MVLKDLDKPQKPDGRALDVLILNKIGILEANGSKTDGIKSQMLEMPSRRAPLPPKEYIMTKKKDSLTRKPLGPLPSSHSINS